MSLIVERYFSSVSQLVAGFLENLKHDDPAGYRRLQVAAVGGAMFKLETAFSTAGILSCELFVIDPDGNSLEIGAIEAQNHAPN